MQYAILYREPSVDVLVMYVILYCFLKFTASNLMSDTLIYDILLRLMLNTAYYLLYKQEPPFIQLFKMLLVYSVSDYFVSFAF